MTDIRRKALALAALGAGVGVMAWGTSEERLPWVLDAHRERFIPQALQERRFADPTEALAAAAEVMGLEADAQITLLPEMYMALHNLRKWVTEVHAPENYPAVARAQEVLRKVGVISE